MNIKLVFWTDQENDGQKNDGQENGSFQSSCTRSPDSHSLSLIMKLVTAIKRKLTKEMRTKHIIEEVRENIIEPKEKVYIRWWASLWSVFFIFSIQFSDHWSNEMFLPCFSVRGCWESEKNKYSSPPPHFTILFNFNSPSIIPSILHFTSPLHLFFSICQALWLSIFTLSRQWLDCFFPFQSKEDVDAPDPDDDAGDGLHDLNFKTITRLIFKKQKRKIIYTFTSSIITIRKLAFSSST